MDCPIATLLPEVTQTTEMAGGFRFGGYSSADIFLNPVCIGCVAFGQNGAGAGSTDIGIELRHSTGGLFLHSLAYNNRVRGITVTDITKNSVASENKNTSGTSGRDFFGTSGIDVDYNLWLDTVSVPSGAGSHNISNTSPMHADPDGNQAYPNTGGVNVDANGNSRTDIGDLDSIFSQVKNMFSLQAGSQAIDSGQWISGVHCATADDDSSNPADPDDPSCRHWLGSAPDRGPYEFGL